ncbi:MAG: DUF3298 domain-containing protein [Candidatus Paceibacterota bacterium]
MTSSIRYVLALILILVIAYLIYMYAPKAPVFTNTATSSAAGASAGTQLKVSDVYASTATYKVEAHYPQFGIPSVDTKIKSTVEKAVAEFESYPANPADSAVPQNEFNGSFNSVYVGADVVSVALLLSEYTGGAHPNTNIVSVNVDPRTGRELTLNDALAMTGKTLSQVATESLAQVETKIGADMTFPEGADPKPENYSTFIISKEKVTFIFNSYQVAPYAAGAQQTEFSRVK